MDKIFQIPSPYSYSVHIDIKSPVLMGDYSLDKDRVIHLDNRNLKGVHSDFLMEKEVFHQEEVRIGSKKVGNWIILYDPS